jgi:hypothetical protein
MLVSVHEVPSQLVMPEGQHTNQPSAVHASPAGHDVHVHIPCTQAASLPRQTLPHVPAQLPHPPQFFGSVLVSVHEAPSQLVMPEGQHTNQGSAVHASPDGQGVHAHAPCTQAASAPKQMLKHSPQFFGSALMFVHE